MNTIDNFRIFSVIVGDGSGCLFQPVSQEYTYVLTARHVVVNAELTEVHRELIDENGDIQIVTLSIIDEPYYHPNADVDAAILKVPFIDDLPMHIRINNLFKEVEGFYLCGFPDVRRDNSSAYRHNSLTMCNTKGNSYVEAEIDRAVIHREIVGQSGGGILKLLNECFAVAAIQKRMSAPDDEESQSRVDIVPLTAFDEIIAHNGQELTFLFPPFMENFSTLVSKTYSLSHYPLRDTPQFSLLQDDLHTIAHQLCEQFSPKEIKERYSTKYLLDENQDYENHYDLWVALLELLTLKQIHSQDNLTLNDLSTINKENKLFFGTVKKNWTELIKDIFKADLSEVEAGGNVFVASAGNETPGVTRASPNLVKSIGSVPPSKMSIHSTIKKPSEDINFRHIYDIQKSIVDNYDLFIDADMENIRDRIIDGTRDIL